MLNSMRVPDHNMLVLFTEKIVFSKYNVKREIPDKIRIDKFVFEIYIYTYIVRIWIIFTNFMQRKSVRSRLLTSKLQRCTCSLE